jgi:acyl dehydratase
MMRGRHREARRLLVRSMRLRCQMESLLDATKNNTRLRVFFDDYYYYRRGRRFKSNFPPPPPPPPSDKTDTNELVLSKTRRFTREDVNAFAKITGDSNPIHLDDGAKKEEKKIVHGALLLSMFPALVGSTFPGAKYLSQTAKFRSECEVDGRVTATVRKIRETRGGKIVEFETIARCAEDDGKIYVDGVALAKIE